MEALAKNSPPGTATPPVPQGWVDQNEWIRLGKPAFVKKGLRIGPFGTERQYLLGPKPALAPPERPLAFKGLLDRAQWLWENLPQHVKSYCQLRIFRESRNRRWKHSLSNPRSWGWKASKGPAAVAPAITSGASQVLYGSGLAGAGSLQFATEVLLNASAPPPWKIQPPDSTTPIPGSFYEHMVAKLDKAKASQKQKAPAPKKFKRDSLEPVGDDWYNAPEKTTNKTSKAEIAVEPDKKAKPRLRLGIWS
jgi:hypothetical protein